jgi:hypothetical protein
VAQRLEGGVLSASGGVLVRPTGMVAGFGSGEHLRTREGCEGVANNTGGGRGGPVTLLTERDDRQWCDIVAIVR